MIVSASLVVIAGVAHDGTTKGRCGGTWFERVLVAGRVPHPSTGVKGRCEPPLAHSLRFSLVACGHLP